LRRNYANRSSMKLVHISFVHRALKREYSQQGESIFVELYTEVVRRGGGDADLGRQLPAIALAAGLGDVRWNVFQPVHASGPHKHMTAVTMERIRPAVLRHGLATNEEIDSVIGGMHAFAEDSSTLVGMPRMVQVWGTA